MSYWCIIITDLSRLWRWSPEQQLLLVDLVSDLSIHLQGFWHDQHPEAPQEGITNLYDMVSICRWLGSYIQCYHPRYKVWGPSLLAQPSKSKQENWMHTFSSTTPGLGVENNLDKVWGYTLSPRRSDMVNASLVPFNTQKVVRKEDCKPC